MASGAKATTDGRTTAGSVETVALPELETRTAVSPIAGKGNDENRDKKKPARTGRAGS